MFCMSVSLECSYEGFGNLVNNINQHHVCIYDIFPNLFHSFIYFYQSVVDLQLELISGVQQSDSVVCVCVCVCVCVYSVMSYSAAPWTVAHQAPLSMEFSRQEYWNGVPFSTPEDLLDLGTKLKSSLAGESFTTAPPEWLFSRV